MYSSMPMQIATFPWNGAIQMPRRLPTANMSSSGGLAQQIIV